MQEMAVLGGLDFKIFPGKQCGDYKRNRIEKRYKGKINEGEKRGNLHRRSRRVKLENMNGKNCSAAANTKELYSRVAPGVGHFL